MDFKNLERKPSDSLHAALLKRNLQRLQAADGTPAQDIRALYQTGILAGRIEFGSDTTVTSNWIPRDVYAQTIFMALHAKRVLGSLAAAVSVDIQKGEGDTIKVRVFPKRTAQGPIAEGVSLTDTANSAATTKSLQIQAYGDFDKITQQSIDFTSDDFKARLLAEFGAALNEKLEQVCYNVLANASSTQTTTLDVASVVDYEEILKAKAKLRLQKMHPDFLIISPDQERDVLLDPNLTKAVDYTGDMVALPGEVGSIGGIRVLVHELALAKSTTSGVVNGIMIDSSRAFGEAFGRPLTYMEQAVPEANTWKEVAWVFYGAGVIDPNAICLMKNA